MSLRSFHIVFVTVVLLMSVFFTLWGFVLSPEKGNVHTVIGICGIVGLILTPIYGIYFWNKAKNIII